MVARELQNYSIATSSFTASVDTVAGVIGVIIRTAVESESLLPG